MNKVKNDMIFSALTISFSVFFLLMSLNIQTPMYSSITGPTTWPRILLIVMLLISIQILFSSIRKVKAMRKEEMDVEDHSGKFHGKGLKNIYKQVYFRILLYIFIYIFALKYIGFMLTTFFLIIAIGAELGLKKCSHLLILGLVCDVLVVYIFAMVLDIPIPRGAGIFRELALLIY